MLRLAVVGLSTLSFALTLAAQEPAKKLPLDPRAELVAKLREIAQRLGAQAKAGDDPLRKLLLERAEVARERLRQACDDFDMHLVPVQPVRDAAHDYLDAELASLTRPEEKIDVLKSVVDLARWYEGRLEAAAKDTAGLRSELLRVRYVRLTFEIELQRLKQPARP